MKTKSKSVAKRYALQANAVKQLLKYKKRRWLDLKYVFVFVLAERNSTDMYQRQRSYLFCTR